MAQLDPRLLMQAAMQQGAAAGAPGGGAPGGAPAAQGAPGDVSAAGGGGPAQGVPPGLPAAPGGAGADPSAASNAQLAQTVGSGTELSQDPQAIQQMMQMLQDPGTPPDQKAQIQMRLQLAALRSVAGGPSGAAGSPQGAQG